MPPVLAQMMAFAAGSAATAYLSWSLYASLFHHWHDGKLYGVFIVVATIVVGTMLGLRDKRHQKLIPRASYIAFVVGLAYGVCAVWGYEIFFNARREGAGLLAVMGIMPIGCGEAIFRLASTRLGRLSIRPWRPHADDLQMISKRRFFTAMSGLSAVVWLAVIVLWILSYTKTVAALYDAADGLTNSYVSTGGFYLGHRSVPSAYIANSISEPGWNLLVIAWTKRILADSQYEWWLYVALWPLAVVLAMMPMAWAIWFIRLGQKRRHIQMGLCSSALSAMIWGVS